MSRGILRAVVAAAGVAMVLAAAGFAVLGCPLGISLRLALPALLLILALLFERWRYQRLRYDPPGPNWVGTDERFVDPETRQPVTVYYHRRTGARRYVLSLAAAVGRAARPE